jgi:hypothetical protein
MKKFIISLPLVLMALGACFPLPIPTSSAPTVDTQGTVDSIALTSVAQTLTAQPTLTPAPVIEIPTDTPDALFLDVTLTPSSTPTPDLTTTPATATDFPSVLTFTPTTSFDSGQVTLTPTLGVLTYGTLPPKVPFTSITLWNRSKAQAYISLQVTLPDGRYSILEYPVPGKFKIDAPLGSYLYVAWVGGRKMDGAFRLRSDDNLVITLYKDRVVVE